MRSKLYQCFALYKRRLVFQRLNYTKCHIRIINDRSPCAYQWRTSLVAKQLVDTFLHGSIPVTKTILAFLAIAELTIDDTPSQAFDVLSRITGHMADAATKHLIDPGLHCVIVGEQSGLALLAVTELAIDYTAGKVVDVKDGDGRRRSPLGGRRRCYILGIHGTAHGIHNALCKLIHASIECSNILGIGDES